MRSMNEEPQHYRPIMTVSFSLSDCSDVGRRAWRLRGRHQPQPLAATDCYFAAGPDWLRRGFVLRIHDYVVDAASSRANKR